jgi:hypothetical protein
VWRNVKAVTTPTDETTRRLMLHACCAVRLVGIRRDIENQVRSMIKEYGLLFRRAVGLRFRKQVTDLLGEGHQLRAVIEPLLLIHEQVCTQAEQIPTTKCVAWRSPLTLTSRYKPTRTSSASPRASFWSLLLMRTDRAAWACRASMQTTGRSTRRGCDLAKNSKLEDYSFFRRAIRPSVANVSTGPVAGS